MCADNEDIMLLKVDWDQNKPIARPLGVKVSQKLAVILMLFLHTCSDHAQQSCLQQELACKL